MLLFGKERRILVSSPSSAFYPEFELLKYAIQQQIQRPTIIIQLQIEQEIL